MSPNHPVRPPGFLHVRAISDDAPPSKSFVYYDSYVSPKAISSYTLHANKILIMLESPGSFMQVTAIEIQGDLVEATLAAFNRALEIAIQERAEWCA